MRAPRHQCIDGVPATIHPVRPVVSRKTGRSKRLRLYDRGNTACPICLMGFTRDRASSGRTVTLEHVPIKALGGQARCLTCRNCNGETGRRIDQAAAMEGRDRFGVTVDIQGKRDTFMLSIEGKALTPPFAGYSKQDLQDLQNSESRTFTMSIRIPHAKAVAASSLKSAYLAMFSLLGPFGGYSYIRGDALTPTRKRIMEPLRDGAVGEFVMKAPDDVSCKDIMLVSEPLQCWMLKIARHLVVLPLSGDSRITRPLMELRKLGGGKHLALSGLASWSFSTFGDLGTVRVHLPSADTATSLLGLHIRGTLANGRPLEGACISQSAESATLLCPALAI